MTTASSTASIRLRRLLVGLGVACLLYLCLLPWLRHLRAETERIDRQTAATETQAAQQKNEIESLRAEVAQHPDDAQKQIRLATALADAGRTEEALTHAEAADRLSPRDTGMLLTLAYLYLREHRYDDSMRIYRSVLALDPNAPRALTGLGWLYISFGWTQDALRLLQPAVKAQPNIPALRVALSLVYLQTTDYAHAEEQLLEVQRMAPDDVSLWSPLVDLYVKMHRPRKAIAIAQEALKRQPDDIRLLDGLSRADYDAGDFQGSIVASRRMLAIRPEELAAHYRLALGYQKAGRAGDARRELEYVAGRDSHFEKTALLLGQLYLQQNRAADGRRLLDQYKQDQGRAETRNHVSYLLAIKTNDPEAHLGMARVYESEGNVPRMIVELHRTLELNPNHEPARQLLAAALNRSRSGRP